MFEYVAREFNLSETWASEVNTIGQRVALYRRYADGNHRANMTANMRAMLRISDETEFNINYCDAIIQTMADRLNIAKIDVGGVMGASKDAMGVWLDKVMWFNAMPTLQMSVHEAAIRDGDTFLMVSYDNDYQIPMLTHELAWDGDTGVVVVYDMTNTNIIGAVKVWWSERDDVIDGKATRVRARRANIYTANRVRKFWFDTWGLIDDPEADVEWRVGYVPIVHFRNNARSRYIRGLSELENVMGLQDTLNRTLVSMTMVGELAAFPINLAFGFTPPATVEPGAWINVGGAEGIADGVMVDVRQLPASPLVPYIQQAQFIIEQMSQVTRTPLTRTGGDTASGESLKQKEIGLLAKVRKAQVRFGEGWEWAFDLARMVHITYGKSGMPPKDGMFMAMWDAAEIRNDSEIIANALKVRDAVGEAEFLRLIAPVYGWDNARIEQILGEKRNERVALVNALPAFGAQFGN